MREHFGRGYYTLAELRSNVRTAVSELTKGERVTAKPCAG